MAANTRSRLSSVPSRSEKAERDDKSPRPNSETQAAVEQPWGNQAALHAAKLVTEPLQDETGLDLDAERRDDEEKKQNGVQEAGFTARLFSSSPAQKSAPAAPTAPTAPTQKTAPPTPGAVPAPQRAEAPRNRASDTPSTSPNQSARSDAPPTSHPAASAGGARDRATQPSANARSTRNAAKPASTTPAAAHSDSTPQPTFAPQPSHQSTSKDSSQPEGSRSDAGPHATALVPTATTSGTPARDVHADSKRSDSETSSASSGSVEHTRVPGHIVDADAEHVDAGQLRKLEFLDALELHVTQAANDALKATLWSADGCPWIAYWFSYYRARSGEDIDRAIRRFAPEAKSARTAVEYIPFVTERVRQAVQVWARTGQTTGLPEGLPNSVMDAARTATQRRRPPGTPIMFKAEAGGAKPIGEASQIAERLGSGTSLEPSVRARIEPLLGHDLGSVRIHTDPQAAELSERMNARAFTVGQHVAFAQGEYRPGTPVGDALLAHELAHVAQQSGAVEESPGAPDRTEALEEDADRSAKGVVQGLWSRGRGFLKGVAENARPRLRSGLSLRACSNSRFPSYSQIVGDAAVQRETDAAWSSTKAATTAAGRREEGFWIQLDMSTSNYRFVNRFTGPTVGPGTGGSANPGTKPADSGSGATGTYTVGLFHTHTPTTYRPVGRAIGPSGADESFHNSNDVVGVVYDYVDSPPGSGNIPAGHPLNSSAQRYHSGPDRRSG